MRSTHENVFAEDTLAAHNIAAGDQTPAPIVKLGDRKRPAVELPRLRLWGGGVWRIFSIQKLLGLSASNQEHNKRLKMERPNTVASEDAGRPVWRGNGPRWDGPHGHGPFGGCRHTAKSHTCRTDGEALDAALVFVRRPARMQQRSVWKRHLQVVVVTGITYAQPTGNSRAARGRRRSSWYPKFSTQDTALAPEYLSCISLN